MTNFKYGFGLYEKPIDEYIDYASKTGFQHIELAFSSNHFSPQWLTKAKIKNLLKQTQKNNITLSLHPPTFINLANYSKFIFEKNLRYVEMCLDLGEQINLKHIILHLGSFYWHTSNKLYRKKALRAVVTSLNKILEIAEQRQISIALENTISLHSGSEMELLGDKVSDFDYIFEHVNSPFLKICLDVGHANITGNTDVFFDHYAEKIICLHLHDNLGKADDHLGIGEGTVDWLKVTNFVQQTNFPGSIIFECFKSEPHEAKLAFEKLLGDAGKIKT